MSMTPYLKMHYFIIFSLSAPLLITIHINFIIWYITIQIQIRSFSRYFSI